MPATLSIDEIMGMVSQIAQDPDAGADRFRALKMLASAGQANVMLPEPLTLEEARARLTRLMKPLGTDMVRICYHEAFPTHTTKPITAPPVVISDDLPAEVKFIATKCRSIRALYRHIPELKRNGMLPGFPLGAGAAVKAKWCQEQAVKALLDREKAKYTAEPKDEPEQAPE